MLNESFLPANDPNYQSQFFRFETAIGWYGVVVDEVCIASDRTCCRAMSIRIITPNLVTDGKRRGGPRHLSV